MTPLEITMLLHFHTIAMPLPNIHYPAQTMAVARFLVADLIYYCPNEPSRSRTTSRGRKVVELLMIFGGALLA